MLPPEKSCSVERLTNTQLDHRITASKIPTVRCSFDANLNAALLAQSVRSLVSCAITAATNANTAKVTK
jgi:hypothetical protein